MALFAQSSLWYDRLAHISNFSLNKVLNSQGISKATEVNKISTCTICALAKTHKFSFISSHVNATLSFELMYFDI